MHKYLLRFFKQGNMRFISHLDLGRLFRRAIKKAGIDIEFSNGFNPHEKMNIVQPLSLGFESKSEYLEIATKKAYSNGELVALLNSSMPGGIEFYGCREIDPSINNMSVKTDAALYSVYVKGGADEFDKIDIDGFLSQDDILIKKRDKKTKTMVDKSVKGMVYGIVKDHCDETGYFLGVSVRCASNESLNPVNLLTSLYEFSGLEFVSENARVKRLDLLAKKDDQFVSLFDFDKDEEF